MKDSLKKESMSGFDKSLKPKMKVSVMSDSEEGIEEGLSKAEEILKKRKEMMKSKDSYECEECEDDGCPHCEETEEDSEDE